MNLIKFLMISSLSILMIGCGSSSSNSSSSSSSSSDTAEVAFVELITNKCSSCHGAASIRDFKVTMTTEELQSGQYIVAQNTSGSEIYRRVTAAGPESTMPEGTSGLTDAEVEIVEAYINSLD